MKLTDKVAIVTGGASGVGRATALLFAAEGAKVAICDVDDIRGASVERELRNIGGVGLFVHADVSTSEEVQALMTRVVAEYGDLTTLHNNAAPIDLVNREDRSVADLPEEVFDRVHAVVARGTYLCCKYALPYLMRSGNASIINTCSVDAVVGQPGYDAYSSAKGAVLSLTRAMAVGYADKGVRVNAVLPGFVRTPPLEEWLSNPVSRRIVESLHLTRIGEPEDIARFVAFLASDDAAFMTGGWHAVDGGFSAFKTRVGDFGAVHE